MSVLGGTPVATVLIVSHQAGIREPLCAAFRTNSEFTAIAGEGGATQVVRDAERIFPDLVIVELRPPMDNHRRLVERLREIVPHVAIFVLVEEYDIEVEKEALAMGISAVFSGGESPEMIFANAEAWLGSQ
jgi:DNA-binding NarL/FixJ family response regulator